MLVRCVPLFGPFDIGIFQPAAAGNGDIEPYRSHRHSDGTGKWFVDSLQVEALVGLVVHSSTQEKNTECG